MSRPGCTGNLAAPFPEEGNRLIIDHLCALHLAPTDDAAANLRAEGIAGGHVLVTGNTVVDAIQYVAAQDLPYSDPLLRTLDHSDRRTVVVTIHRRESWGSPMRRILGAVRELASTHPDIDIVLPAHPNGDVRRLVEQELGETDRVLISDPLVPGYGPAVSCGPVLTDSGGIQDEAPSFGAPVLVLRDTTERPEAVATGVARPSAPIPIASWPRHRARWPKVAARCLTRSRTCSAMVSRAPLGPGDRPLLDRDVVDSVWRQARARCGGGLARDHESRATLAVRGRGVPMFGLYRGVAGSAARDRVATGITLIHFATILMLRAANRERAPRVPDRPLHYIFMVPASTRSW